MSSITSEYVEQRDGGYYIAGSRISLDSVVYAFRRGEAPETILENFPAIGSLAKVYGAIAFALDHPQEIDTYLTEQERHWEKGRQTNPAAFVEKVRQVRHETDCPLYLKPLFLADADLHPGPSMGSTSEMTFQATSDRWVVHLTHYRQMLLNRHVRP